jgi:hypothetical protein
MRALALAAALLPGVAAAEGYADFGHPEQCGAYEQAGYDRQSWFPGGEGGAMALADPQQVQGLNAMLYQGTIVEEGFSDSAGRVMAVRGPLLAVGGQAATDVLVVVTEAGIRLLQPCP